MHNQTTIATNSEHLWLTLATAWAAADRKQLLAGRE